MTGWLYNHGERIVDHYDFPDDFEFGAGENDDELFDKAWNALISQGWQRVRFPRMIDSELLNDRGAALMRSMPVDKSELEGLTLPQAFNALMDLPMEAIFKDHHKATLAAIEFGTMP